MSLPMKPAWGQPVLPMGRRPAGQSADTAALCEKTGLAPGRLMAALTRLEMRGLVRQRPGRRFEKAL